MPKVFYINQAFFVVTKLFLILTIAFCSACYSSELRNDARIYFLNPDGSKTKNFKVEIAKTPKETSKGMMYRRSMPEDSGMLFIFPRMEERSFWMKNTYIPLDMIFIDSDYKVVNVVHNAPPLSQTSRKSIYPCMYVLELYGGVAEKAGIVSGSVMQYE